MICPEAKRPMGWMDSLCRSLVIEEQQQGCLAIQPQRRKHDRRRRSCVPGIMAIQHEDLLQLLALEFRRTSVVLSPAISSTLAALNLVLGRHQSSHFSTCASTLLACSDAVELRALPCTLLSDRLAKWCQPGSKIDSIQDDAILRASQTLSLSNPVKDSWSLGLVLYSRKLSAYCTPDTRGYFWRNCHYNTHCIGGVLYPRHRGIVSPMLKTDSEQAWQTALKAVE
jgi:hypothetical protein